MEYAKARSSRRSCKQRLSCFKGAAARTLLGGSTIFKSNPNAAKEENAVRRYASLGSTTQHTPPSAAAIADAKKPNRLDRASKRSYRSTAEDCNVSCKKAASVPLVKAKPAAKNNWAAARRRKSPSPDAANNNAETTWAALEISSVGRRPMRSLNQPLGTSRRTTHA
jgi:hypothetical protein